MTKLPLRIRPGYRVYLENMPVLELEVINTTDPAIATLRAPNGATLKAGRKTIMKEQARETSCLNVSN